MPSRARNACLTSHFRRLDQHGTNLEKPGLSCVRRCGAGELPAAKAQALLGPQRTTSVYYSDILLNGKTCLPVTKAHLSRSEHRERPS